MICEHCRDTGHVAIDIYSLAYRCPGPVPEGARGVTEVACWFCAHALAEARPAPGGPDALISDGMGVEE